MHAWSQFPSLCQHTGVLGEQKWRRLTFSSPFGALFLCSLSTASLKVYICNLGKLTMPRVLGPWFPTMEHSYLVSDLTYI